MKSFNDKEFDQFLKNKVEEFNFPFEERYWLETKKLLEEKKKKSPIYFGTWLSVFLTSTLAATAIWFGHSYFQKSPKIVSEKEQIHLSEAKYQNSDNDFEETKNRKEIRSSDGNNFNFVNTQAPKSKSDILNYENPKTNRKKSAQFLVNAERVKAICKTILIYTHPTLKASNYVPVQSQNDSYLALSRINTKSLFSSPAKSDLKKEFRNTLKIKKEGLKIWNRRVRLGVGGGSKVAFTNSQNLNFHQFLGTFIQISVHPLWLVQIQPSFSSGKTPDYLQRNSSPQSLQIVSVPLEVGFRLKQHSVFGGILYQKAIKNPEIDGNAALSLSYQAQYGKFMLRLSSQYGLKNIPTNGEIEKSFWVGLFYQLHE